VQLANPLQLRTSRTLHAPLPRFLRVVILGGRNREFISLLPRLSVAASGHLWCQNSYPPRDISVRAWSDALQIMGLGRYGSRLTSIRILLSRPFGCAPMIAVDAIAGDSDESAISCARTYPRNHRVVIEKRLLRQTHGRRSKHRMWVHKCPVKFLGIYFVAACNRSRKISPVPIAIILINGCEVVQKFSAVVPRNEQHHFQASIASREAPRRRKPVPRSATFGVRRTTRHCDLPISADGDFNLKQFPAQRGDIRELLDTRPNLMDTVSQM